VALWALGLGVAALAALGTPGQASEAAQVTGDEPQYLLTAISLAEDWNLDIADELASERWRAFHAPDLFPQTAELADGRRVSPHDPLLPLLLAGPVALGGWVGAKLALSAAAGALAAVLLWIAVRRFSAPLATAVTTVAVSGLSVPLAAYGHQVYPEIVGALAVSLGLAAVTGPMRRAGPVILVVAVAALPWLAVKYTPLAAVLALAGVARLWRMRRRRHAVVVAGVLALAGVAFLALHQALYGGWTPYATGIQFSDQMAVVGRDPNFWGRSRRLLGLLVGESFGIAAWQPAWLLAVGALAAVMRARPAGWSLCVGVVAVGWLVATFVALTMHGYWFPGRQLVVLLPAVVPVIGWWAAGSRAARWVLTGAGALGVATYLWLLVEVLAGRVYWVFEFTTTANPWYRLWRFALPDYLQVTWTTWALHGVWVVCAAGLSVWGWRSAPAARRASLPRAAAE
jgi:hypothetical protein